MSTQPPLSKITATRAADVCALFELSEEAQPLLDETLEPGEFLARLMQHKQYADATRFLAYALPKREGVWWACLAARAGLDEKAQPLQATSLQTAEQWVFKPVEENRRPTFKAAEAAGLDNPASWAAVAAFWSSGSMAPAGQPIVPPADDLCPKAVAGAVMLAAVSGEPKNSAEKYQAFLRQGIDIAKGGSGRPEGTQS